MLLECVLGRVPRKTQTTPDWSVTAETLPASLVPLWSGLWASRGQWSYPTWEERCADVEPAETGNVFGSELTEGYAWAPTGWAHTCTEGRVTGPAEGRGCGQDVGKATGPGDSGSGPSGRGEECRN